LYVSWYIGAQLVVMFGLGMSWEKLNHATFCPLANRWHEPPSPAPPLSPVVPESACPLALEALAVDPELDAPVPVDEDEPEDAEPELAPDAWLLDPPLELLVDVGVPELESALSELPTSPVFDDPQAAMAPVRARATDGRTYHCISGMGLFFRIG
jgi:hypothetical protein